VTEEDIANANNRKVIAMPEPIFYIILALVGGGSSGVTTVFGERSDTSLVQECVSAARSTIEVAREAIQSEGRNNRILVDHSSEIEGNRRGLQDVRGEAFTVNDANEMRNRQRDVDHLQDQRLDYIEQQVR
jgi:hypothetical protein